MRTPLSLHGLNSTLSPLVSRAHPISSLPARPLISSAQFTTSTTSPSKKVWMPSRRLSTISRRTMSRPCERPLQCTCFPERSRLWVSRWCSVERVRMRFSVVSRCSHLTQSHLLIKFTSRLAGPPPFRSTASALDYHGPHSFQAISTSTPHPTPKTSTKSSLSGSRTSTPQTASEPTSPPWHGVLRLVCPSSTRSSWMSQWASMPSTRCSARGRLRRWMRMGVPRWRRWVHV